ncbi:MAG: lysylphosphatidylglycerol synthase transmembrane domain-containing protein [Candidatus Competibacter sp.]
MDNRWFQQGIGFIISLLCLIVIARQIKFEDVRIALANFQWLYMFWGLASLTFGYAIRIARWSVLLKTINPEVSIVGCVGPFLGSIALNNILPMRLGDIMRALVFPSILGIGKATATSSLIIERLIDLVTLLVCLFVGFIFTLKAELSGWITKSAFTVGISSILILGFILFFSAPISSYCESFLSYSWVKKSEIRIKFFIMAMNLLKNINVMSRLPILASLFLFSALIWLGEAGFFWALLIGFRFSVGPEAAIFVMAATTLSTLIPSSPGYIGSFHLAAFAAASVLGSSSEQSASFAVLSHLGVWLPTTLAGIVAILLNPKLFASLGVKRKNV